MNDPKVESLAVRMHNMTVASSVTIQQAASAHMNCLANLALEDADGDGKKAAAILRNAADQLIVRVYDPSIRRKIAVVAGRIVSAIGGRDG